MLPKFADSSPDIFDLLLVDSSDADVVDTEGPL